VVLSPGAARVLALVVLLTIGLAGLAGGVALDRYVILPRRFGIRPPSDIRAPFFGPRGRQAFADRLHQYLELTPDQRTRFDSLMDREERELRAARSVAQPRIDSIVSETRREVDAILTPAQREKLHKLREDELGPGRAFGGRDSGDPDARPLGGRRGGPPIP
jgi:Spy/CpxP family protein refolding chaperone